MAKTNVSLGWAGMVRGGEAVYTSQDEPAMTKASEGGPGNQGALEASGSFHGHLALRMAGLHPCHTCRTSSSA